ncbi:hypothetical protein [Marinobacter salicampi]|uniref:hypothetical protein n=1 Tax=Marinobacter salicampi TaxID=435907 RepID=UPI0014076163|nr:hypothetical protein [Marinobacter salicampi]
MSKEIVAYHLSSEQKLSFVGSEPFICPEWAVVYGYAMENNRTGEALNILHDHREDLVPALKERFPIRYGQRSVGCGDWATLLASSEAASLNPLPH